VRRRKPPWFLIVSSLTLFASCTTTIRAPAPIADPSVVLLLSHGISSSLVLADEKGRAVRFAYGDWRYYALGRTGIRNAIAAIVCPTPSALGRQVIEGAAEQPEALIAQIGIGYGEMLLIRAERQAVRRLRQQLESLFLAAIETRVYNPEPRLEFVRHPEPYSLFNNSNQKIAGWLRALGAEVSGVPLLPNWRLDPSARSLP
jgi:hypothetical protein